MQLFNYIAKDNEGKTLKGDLEAQNEANAARILLEKNYFPIQISPINENKKAFSRNKIPLKRKVILIKQLSTMINAGLPISEALSLLKDQETSKFQKKMLVQISSDIQGGGTLSQSMSKFPDVFKALDISLISSAEKSGSLDLALKRLANQLEKEQTLTRKVRGAFVYPSFIIVVVVIVSIIMLLYVMPQMEALYGELGSELPLLTRIFISVSNFIGIIGPVLIVLVVAATYLIKRWIQTTNGRLAWDSMKIKIPLIKDLLIKLYMARFTRTLSGLVSSGIAILEALTITAESVGNVVYKNSTLEIASEVKTGISLSDGIKKRPVFLPVVPQMISVGEKTGEIDNMLESLADYLEEEVDNAVKNITSLIEPLIIVFLALFIGVILVAIMLPAYQLGGTMFG